jgi:hypothetical protein
VAVRSRRVVVNDNEAESCTRSEERENVVEAPNP